MAKMKAMETTTYIFKTTYHSLCTFFNQPSLSYFKYHSTIHDFSGLNYQYWLNSLCVYQKLKNTTVDI